MWKVVLGPNRRYRGTGWTKQRNPSISGPRFQPIMFKQAVMLPTHRQCLACKQIHKVCPKTFTFKHYFTIHTCLLKPADKLPTESLLSALTSSFFGRIIPFENSVNKYGQLYVTHTSHKNIYISASKWIGSTDLRKILNLSFNPLPSRPTVRSCHQPTKLLSYYDHKLSVKIFPIYICHSSASSFSKGITGGKCFIFCP